MLESAIPLWEGGFSRYVYKSTGGVHQQVAKKTVDFRQDWPKICRIRWICDIIIESAYQHLYGVKHEHDR
jgi:hypothetical protein